MNNIRLIVFSSVFAAAVSAFGAAPKYVFLFIGDGMSVPQRMTANEFSIKTTGHPLEMNQLPVSGLCRSCSADSLVTDSAAAATALACGVKTKNHYTGVNAAGEPVESCAEMAKRAGRKVGIMTTVTITHATPAGFYAHNRNRGDTEAIVKDLAKSGFDYFAGGGFGVDLKKSKAYEEVAAAGYRMVSHRDDFRALKSGDGKVCATFGNWSLENDIDYDESLDQPRIRELLAKAVELLDGDAGFFIMCEGGRIDWSAHGNDSATNLRDVLALNEAVKVALEFQKRHPDDTLIIVTGDHETGGMSMGFAGTAYSLFTENLTNQTMSVGRFNAETKKIVLEKKLAVAFDDVKPLITRGFGLLFTGDAKTNPMVMNKKELASLEEAFEHDVRLLKQGVKETDDYMAKLRYTLGNACRTVIMHKSGVDWSSGAHTALPVLVTASGAGAESFTGFYENNEIGIRLKAMYAEDVK